MVPGSYWMNSLDSNFHCNVRSIGEVVSEYLDGGLRERQDLREVPGDSGGGIEREYRVRRPTNSERLNRALRELGLSAFKVHTLIWKWRGAPARGLLPYFTIRGLEKFCNLTRPTVRVALRELVDKGWIQRHKYNEHHKNTLFRLVPIRKVPPPTKDLSDSG